MLCDLIGIAAFHDTIASGRLIHAKQLHAQGINLYARNIEGEPVLYIALTKIRDVHARASMVQWLLHAGADTGYVDPRTGRNLLATATCVNGSAEVAVLLEYCSSGCITAHDHKGRTPLHYAVLHNDIRAVHSIVSAAKFKGLTVDVADNDDWSPFMMATVLGFHDVRNVMIRYCPDMNDTYIPDDMTLEALKYVYDDFKWYPNNKVTLIPQTRPLTSNSVSHLGTRPSTCPAPPTSIAISPRPVSLMSPRYGRHNANNRSFPQWTNRPRTHQHHTRGMEYGNQNSYNRQLLVPYTDEQYAKGTIRPKTSVQRTKTSPQTISSSRRSMLSSYGCGASSTDADHHSYALLPASATSPRSSASYVRYYLSVHAAQHGDSYRAPAVRPSPAPEPPSQTSTGTASLSIGMLAKISGMAGKGKKGMRRESMNSARESLTSARRSEGSSKHS